MEQRLIAGPPAQLQPPLRWLPLCSVEVLAMAAALERKIGEGQSMHVTYLDVFRELGVMLKWATRGKAVSAADTAFYPTAEELEELKAMFCLYDKDRNATLDLKELRAAASSCGFNAEEVGQLACGQGMEKRCCRAAQQAAGHKARQARVESLFDAADIDKDKKISFDEFVQMMSMCYM
ncbi:hypothetical protein QJQ45_013725 [Haematococcus lacustris]|nr:hypothetical protein QJQ45_013725 [Haematococcus lacustris]